MMFSFEAQHLRLCSGAAHFRSCAIVLGSYSFNRTVRLQRIVSVDEEEIVAVDPIAFAAALAMEKTGREKVHDPRCWYEYVSRLWGVLLAKTEVYMRHRSLKASGPKGMRRTPPALSSPMASKCAERLIDDNTTRSSLCGALPRSKSFKLPFTNTFASQ